MKSIKELFLPWLEATRPKTLAASIIPVMLGTAAASIYSQINLPIALLILICALLIQIITNYINEIYDNRRGADRSDRLGPKRQVASGVISEKKMAIVTSVLIIITFLIGLNIVAYSDYIVLIIGVISLLFAYLYTGGPYPLAYNGLGDVFVFIFFGLFAVCGTYYVFVGRIDTVALLVAVPPGLLSTNILAVNNIRDIKTDEVANKITLAVKLGRKNAAKLYQILNLSSYIAVITLAFVTASYFIILPILTLPLALKLNFDIAHKQGAALNQTLANTGKLLFLFGILLTAGLLATKLNISQ